MRACWSGNKEEVKNVPNELSKMIREWKKHHQEEDDGLFLVWQGLKTISGYKEPNF